MSCPPSSRDTWSELVALYSLLNPHHPSPIMFSRMARISETHTNENVFFISSRPSETVLTWARALQPDARLACSHPPDTPHARLMLHAAPISRCHCQVASPDGYPRRIHFRTVVLPRHNAFASARCARSSADENREEGRIGNNEWSYMSVFIEMDLRASPKGICWNTR